MKKSFLILLGIISFSMMSFTSVEELTIESDNIEIVETIKAENAVFAFAGANCCSSYVTYQGETFEAVRVCGGSSVEDYIGNCIRAESIRDNLLASISQ